ncbi:hypothetical protein SAMN05421805_12546 [Saccharopolyspora antimicrobica]|uniref:Uncharacterized protein n=1 Tax=Saccharopolyspora antimicrobica TaxID=455193 RepID=A0A1I5K400_9PSEU|nr:hypothetical protein [Saccharopolyspora antimicrobica]RKT84785.1 hypothetical protein ATL45_3112 [Saccharopolyspora antimicrobica]SFO79730.1 hypothetical protein SAMN05421805_12546 [Saccharopolyspora antimicrobica]
MPMIVWWRKPPSAKGRPDGRALVAARVCVVAPWVYLAVFLPVAVLAPVTAWVGLWGLRVLVVLAVAGLIAVFVRHPHDDQDGDLTFTMGFGSVLMALPALMGLFWPLALLPQIVPLLMIAAAIRRRLRRGSGDSEP